MGRSKKEIPAEEIVFDLMNTNMRMRMKFGSREAAAGYTAALAVRDNPNSLETSEEFYKLFLLQEKEAS